MNKYSRIGQFMFLFFIIDLCAFGSGVHVPSAYPDPIVAFLNAALIAALGGVVNILSRPL